MTTEAKPIAETLPDLETLTDATASKKPATALSTQPKATLAELRAMTLPLAPSQLSLVKRLAEHCPVDEPCDEVHFAKCLRLLATLPRRTGDELTGELLLALYRRMLGHHTAGAINFLTEAALAKCKWMPTVAECLTILERYRRDDEPMRIHLAAGSLLLRDRQAKYDGVMQQLAGQRLSRAEIDALPESWRRAAVTYGHLRPTQDGQLDYPRPIGPPIEIATPNSGAQAA